MSFTDQKQFTVTGIQCGQSWGGGVNGKYFKCGLCGHKFKAGDKARWIFTNDMKGAGGNPLVCEKCDGTNEEVRQKWEAMHMKFNGFRKRFWWFFRHK